MHLATSILLCALSQAPGADGLPIPSGPEPAPVPLPHFPRKLDAFVFRNWSLVAPARLAAVAGTDVESILALGRDLGLDGVPQVSDEARRRSTLTVIRRNWHLLPYPQLLDLLGWREEQLGYALREDDFLWIKLGSLKPRCEPIRFAPADAAIKERHQEIAAIVREALGARGLAACEPRFAFLDDLRRTETDPPAPRGGAAPGGPRAGEVDLSHGWSLVEVGELGAISRGAIERFARRLTTVFGARLLPTRPDTAAPAIVASLEPARFERGPDAPASEEAHEIRVLPGRVEVIAAAEAGLLRALDRLVERLEERGGPWLAEGVERRVPRFAVRFLHSYFALYGDALLEPGLDPYPDGYLEKLARLGVNGVWLPALLRGLAPHAERLGLVPAAAGAAREARLASLRDLVARARRHGIGVYLYLNEPRAMPLAWFEGRPELRGVVKGDTAALCTSVPAVREWIEDSIAHLLESVPDLAGLFTITASENLTSCWSHHGGKGCGRCAARGGAEVTAEVNRLILAGARRASSRASVIAWDWGWLDDWIEPAIAALAKDSKRDGRLAVMSVSEWSLPIRRGGVESTVGEYSISSVGPGPRAQRTWEIARRHGLAAIAKVQAGNSWELSAVPYIPAVRLVAEHARNLASAGVDGVMLGWTLGGYPSPNLEAMSRASFALKLGAAGGGSLEDVSPPSPLETLSSVARRRFGPALGPRAAAAWDRLSEAFLSYPYHAGLVYSSPVQLGPANLLHAEPTGYGATMVGFPYDDLDGWRAVYPPEVMAAQFEKLAAGWAEGLTALPPAAAPPAREGAEANVQEIAAYEGERRVVEAALLHFQSVAAQTRFVLARRAYRAARDAGRRDEALARIADLETLARAEEESARRLLSLACRDSRLGFEASNQYYYVPLDLVEKVLSCRWLAGSWAAAERARLRNG